MPGAPRRARRAAVRGVTRFRAGSRFRLTVAASGAPAGTPFALIAAVTNVALVPAVAMVLGTLIGVYTTLPAAFAHGGLALALAWGWMGYVRRWPGWWVAGCASVGFVAMSCLRGVAGVQDALDMPATIDLRGGPSTVTVEGTLSEDASPADYGASLLIRLERFRGRGPGLTADGDPPWRETRGTLRLSVGGAQSSSRLDEWRGGRRVRATVRVRAPPAYRNFNLVDRQALDALRGVHVHGAVKSAAMVEVVAPGSWWQEAASTGRAYVRRALRRHVGRDGERSSERRERRGGERATAESAALAVAILIGDRAGLAPETEGSLQRAGTIHILAISGGNIALLALLLWAWAVGLGVSPRGRAVLVIALLLFHAQIVSGGTSVARATMVAVVWLGARASEHGTRPVNALAVVVAGLAMIWPLSVSEPAFWLTVMASLAIVVSARPLGEWVWRTMAAALTRWRWILLPPRLARTARSPPGRIWRRLLRGRRGRLRALVAFVLRAGVWLRREASRAGWRALRSAVMLCAATLAVESVIVPFTAYFFSQVTVAGLAGNLVAVPAAAVVQVGSLCCLALGWLAPAAADGVGGVVHLAARAILWSAVALDGWPWLAMRVPPPPVWLVVWCAIGWCLTVWAPGDWRAWRDGSASLFPEVWPFVGSPVKSSVTTSGMTVGFGSSLSVRCGAGAVWAVGLGLVWLQPWLPALPEPTVAPRGVETCREPALPDRGPGRWLRVTMIDVAQGDATLVRSPGGAAWLVDAGGVPSPRFDVGARVVAPALWALGVRRLEALALTHEDIDHVGGAISVMRDFGPRVIWHGDGGDAVLRRRLGATAPAARVLERAVWRSRARGMVEDVGGVGVRVWHPSRAAAGDDVGWRGGNDRSLVLELRLRDVSILLPGDIGAAPERDLSALVRPSAMAVLKAPHHGSRFSSTDLLLDAVRPAVVVVSVGRNNPHGHPAEAVLRRYRARAVPVFRTDLDGAVAVDTDGVELRVASCSGRRLVLRRGAGVPGGAAGIGGA